MRTSLWVNEGSLDTAEKVYQVADILCRTIRATNGMEGETIDDN